MINFYFEGLDKKKPFLLGKFKSENGLKDYKDIMTKLN